MKRGELWTASGGKDDASKPLPAVIVQDDSFEFTDSIAVCPFTTDPADSFLIRLQIEPDSLNGLQTSSRIMVDKIATLPKSKLGVKIGRLADEEMVRLNRAMVVFLGISSRPRSSKNA